MQTLDVKYTDRIHGFQGRLLKVVTKAEQKIELGRSAAVRDADWKTRCALIKLTRRHHECAFGAGDVRASFRRTRYVQDEPLGELQTSYEVDMHLLACNVCGKTRYDAKSALEDWCQAARASGIFEMCQMANMVEKHLEGILGYWDFGHANNGSAEGFNTKVRLLMKQSCGLRDFKYLKLKIMDLPSRKIRVSI